jgi:hypothetical protein
MKTALITISELAPTIAISPDAKQARDRLLASAATVDAVDSNAAALYASDILKDIKQMTRFVEVGRTDAKAPLLDYGRKVDAIAKELTGELDQVAKDLAFKIGVWTSEQQRLARIEMEKARAEELRLVAQKRAEERAIYEREQKELAELAAKAKQATSAPDAIALAVEQEHKLREHEFAQQQRDDAMQQTLVTLKTNALEKAGPRPSGIATRMVLKYEVTDIRALYAAAPHCVKMEAVAGVLQSVLKNLPEGGTLPGVRHWSEPVAVVR